MKDWTQRIQKLQDLGLEALVARVAELEEQIGLSLKPPTVFGLSNKETAVLGILLANRYPRKETFMAALYSDRADAPHVKVIDVFVCKVRRKLSPLGIEIKTLFGVGYEMPEASKHRARQLMDAA